MPGTKFSLSNERPSPRRKAAWVRAFPLQGKTVMEIRMEAERAEELAHMNVKAYYQAIKHMIPKHGTMEDGNGHVVLLEKLRGSDGMYYSEKDEMRV